MLPQLCFTVTDYPKIPKLKLSFAWRQNLSRDELDRCVETVEAAKLIPADAKGTLGFHLHGENLDDVKITVDG